MEVIKWNGNKIFMGSVFDSTHGRENVSGTKKHVYVELSSKNVRS